MSDTGGASGWLSATWAPVTCNTHERYAMRMTHLQIRDVPADVHRTLKARAAAAGLSLSDYLLVELRRLAERPTRDEVLARIAARPQHVLHPRPAAVVRAERDHR